jgi:molybdenum cofactor cytidylyltransferase
MKPVGDLVGVVLAAGRSRRFGTDKLLHPLPDGTPMALACALALRAVAPRTVAVVGAHSVKLAALFAAHGIETTIAEHADSGMGASLAAGVAATTEAGGWLVALGDMPYIRPQTVARVASTLRAGARLAAPGYQGERGHPVGFSAWFRTELLALRGEQGARALLQRHAGELVLVDCGDPGVLVDVDQPAALIPPG